jgi:hypothetical protein
MDQRTSAHRVAVIIGATIVLASPARAETFHFKGRTTVDMTVAKDALRDVQQIGLAKLHCGVIEAVNAEVLPRSYRPARTENYAPNGRETYEKWNVILCGRTTPFLLGFWPAAEGGTMFHVRYPFPPRAKVSARASKID